MEEKLLKIIKHYGVMPQLKHFQSEVWELNEAIYQYEEQKRVCEQNCTKLHCDKEREHIAEEIADVLVMVNQFIQYYDISADDIEAIFEMKIDRQIERIENENN